MHPRVISTVVVGEPAAFPLQARAAMSRTRSVSVCVAIAGLLWSAHARAESGMLPNGASLTFNRVFINEGGSNKEPSTPDALRSYLNLAHCVCAQSNAGEETTISYEMKLSTVT